MATTLANIPIEYTRGAERDITWADSGATSESGISASKATRLVPIRNWHLTFGPDQIDEVEKIYLSGYGPHYPFGIRDWRDYKFIDEVCTYTSSGGTTTISLRKKFQPSTGSRVYYQRILLVDESEVSLSIKVDGVTLSSSNWTLIDFGKITTLDANVPGGSVVTATGQFFYPARFPENSMTTEFVTQDLGQIKNVSVLEILEQELIKRTS